MRLRAPRIMATSRYTRLTGSALRSDSARSGELIESGAFVAPRVARRDS